MFTSKIYSPVFSFSLEVAQKIVVGWYRSFAEKTHEVFYVDREKKVHATIFYQSCWNLNREGSFI